MMITNNAAESATRTASERTMRVESPLADTMWYKPEPRLAIIASSSTMMSA